MGNLLSALIVMLTLFFAHLPSRFCRSLYVIGLAVCLPLAGCEQATQLKQRILHPASGVASTPVTTTDSQTSTLSTRNNEPVSYPFSTWQQQPLDPRLQKSPKNLAVIQQFLNEQLANTTNLPDIDQQRLDYQGNKATQYRFTADHIPPLRVIDSTKYLEFRWYHASDSDQSSEKKLAVTYASLIYQLTRATLGNRDGDKLMQAILAGDTIKNRSNKGTTVVMARCEVFDCMIVLKK